MSTQPPTESRLSTSAIISYAAILIFFLMVTGVFGLVMLRVPVESVMLTLLGSVITAVVGGFTAVLAFWLGSSSGAKTSSAALAQLAGAGPPPPAAPGSGTPPGEASAEEPNP